MSFTETLKQDTKEAGVRIASKKISGAVKGSLLTLMKKNKMKKAQLRAFSDFLETEMGTVLIDLVLGWGLTYAPMISNDPRVKKVAEEFRVKGSALAGNLLIDTVAEQALPVLMQHVSLLDDKVRVDVGAEEEADEPQELKAKAVAK